VTVVYHVETHRNPRQIERLARALLVRTPDAVVVIDHDKRFEGPDRRVLDKLGAHLRLSDGGYGDMSHVYRWMQTAEWLASENISYTWMSNLTGQDYPIRPLDRVHAELAASPADAYIQTFDVLDADETHWGVARGRTRYEYSHRRLKRFSLGATGTSTVAGGEPCAAVVPGDDIHRFGSRKPREVTVG